MPQITSELEWIASCHVTCLPTNFHDVSTFFVLELSGIPYDLFQQSDTAVKPGFLVATGAPHPPHSLPVPCDHFFFLILKFVFRWISCLFKNRNSFDIPWYLIALLIHILILTGHPWHFFSDHIFFIFPKSEFLLDGADTVHYDDPYSGNVEKPVAPSPEFGYRVQPFFKVPQLTSKSELLHVLHFLDIWFIQHYVKSTLYTICYNRMIRLAWQVLLFLNT